LTKSDVNTVRNAVWDARAKWKQIGSVFGLTDHHLNAIKAARRDVGAVYHLDIEKCFVDVLILWLKQVDPPPTWSSMVAALRDATVGEGELADQVEYKYILDMEEEEIVVDITNSDPTMESQEGEFIG
jgi:hypothetical protein